VKFILYFMLFTTPPAAKGQEVWSLQNSTAMEFDSKPACVSAVNEIITSVKKTDTVRLYGWCFPKGAVDTKDLAPLAEDRKGEVLQRFKSYP
jgi:hypothetical protein